MTQNHLETERLLLRPFDLTDAADVQRLAGDREIAATTRLIPHPYPDGAAEEWIKSAAERAESGTLACFAITLRGEGQLIGSIGLTIQPEDERAELGYWIGKDYWGQGYCSEAARAIVRHGFEQLGLNRVYAHCMSSNPASARVLEKIPMQHEGRCRQHFKKWGEYQDIELYGVLKSDFR